MEKWFGNVLPVPGRTRTNPRHDGRGRPPAAERDYFRLAQPTPHEAEAWTPWTDRWMVEPMRCMKSR